MLDWAATEGWNPGLDDASLFHRADPQGFFMALDEQRPAAAISVVRHDSQHGFLGLYICHPDYRGQGYGWAVWEAGMRHLDGMVVGLDGVVEQQENYRKSGFDLAYRNIRYAGSTTALSGMAVSDAGSIVRAYDAADWSALLAMDARIHGYRREQLLASWVMPSVSRVSLVCMEGGRLRAFGTIRECREGFKIGPLLAVSSDHALTMLSRLVAKLDARTIMLDVPEPNQAGKELAESLGLTAVFETARMFKGGMPDYSLDELFGVASFELG